MAAYLFPSLIVHGHLSLVYTLQAISLRWVLMILRAEVLQERNQDVAFWAFVYCVVVELKYREFKKNDVSVREACLPFFLQ